MKRIALFAVAATVLSACGAKEAAPPADSSSMMAPAASAPAPTMDSAPKPDSMAMAAPKDTTVKK